jgi:hypothetical protein
MKPGTSVCGKKTELLSEYDTATQAYVAAVNELRAKISISSKAVYERLYAAAEEARSKSENARKLLLKHRREHNC